MFIILKNKYNVKCSYDPCSYPGIQCKYKIKNENEISFMIFRTGSCLVVGNCSEKILLFVFDFIKRFLSEEYDIIRVINEEPVNKIKKMKLRKKNIIVSNDYFENVVT